MTKIPFCLVLAFSCTFAFTNTNDFINEINRKQNIWTASRNSEGTSENKYRRLLGLRNPPQNVVETFPLMEHDIADVSEIPESFDARTKWSNCKTISEVPDQSSCGSSWVNEIT